LKIGIERLSAQFLHTQCGKKHAQSGLFRYPFYRLSNDFKLGPRMNNSLNPDVNGTQDIDPDETREWMESLESVIAKEGSDRASFLIEKLVSTARQSGSDIPFSATTAYINSISVENQPKYPGNTDIERTIRSYVRWNAMMMVLRANKYTNVGGHIASFASAVTLYDVGQNHFWHAPSEKHGGDLILSQGHSAPGTYANAFLLGRLSENQMDNFRQEVGGNGLSSYPHPWLMPDFWQFPTVSMGLGPIMAIYQARSCVICKTGALRIPKIVKSGLS
jgi:pyruvate dehydrogenase E1 component